MKRVLAMLLAIALLTALLPMEALGAEAAVVASGSGWQLNANGKMTVTGNTPDMMPPMYDPLDGYRDQIQEVYVADGVTSLGDSTFYQCKNLSAVRLPGSLTSIGGAAFRECEALTAITLPDAVTQIGGNAFAGCINLTEIRVPDGVTSLSVTFGGCSALKTVYLPAGLTEIRMSTFQLCDSLTDVYFAGTKAQWDQININPEYNEALFSATIHYAEAPTSGTCGENLTWALNDGVLTISGTGAMDDCLVNNVLEAPWNSQREAVREVVVAEGVTSIGVGAFCNMSNVEQIRIPKTVQSIGDKAFLGCDSLTSITVDPDNPVFNSENGVLYRDKTCLLVCPAAFAGELILPESVQSIADYAFLDCAALTAIRLRGDKPQIGDRAFMTLVDLKVYYPQNNGTYNSFSSHSAGNIKWEAYSLCDKFGHVEETVPGLAPTCISIGITDSVHCTRCGETLVESKKIPVIAHQLETVEGKAPTCTEPGLTDGTRCKSCNQVQQAQEVIPKLGHIEVIDEAISPTYTTPGKTEGVHCGRCSAILTPQEEVPAEGFTVQLSKTAFTYNGKVQKPTVTVLDGAGNEIPQEEYTVSFGSGMKYVGRYPVTVTMKDDAEATQTVTFEIRPPKTSISKLTAGKKSFTVKWSKKTSQVTGYQIQYSKSSKFTSAKTATVSKNSTVSKTIKKLTGGAKYYVRIRTYKTVNGVRFYSAWSSAKSIKTKK